MKNHDNQYNERAIYLKDLHQWVTVSKTDYDNYYRDINAYRRRQQEHGRCVCPASKRYLCDMDCCTCRFRKGGDELSFDYSITDEDGNEKSWLDDLPDDSPGAESVLEERELLMPLCAGGGARPRRSQYLRASASRKVGTRDSCRNGYFSAIHH